MSLRRDPSLIVLTGAGISAESGIKTFRDAGGLWENHRIEEVASPDGFRHDPLLVWNFYKARYTQALEASPNPGHYALVELEQKYGDQFHIITQNVDGLHQKAGSHRVMEMHGRLRTALCTRCTLRHELSTVDLSLDLPQCPDCGGLLRPDIVWFGEIPYYLEQIEELLKNCALMLVIGSSGVVYPAAGFVQTAKYFGAKTICLNAEQPEQYRHFDEFHQGKAGELLQGLVKRIINDYPTLS